MRLWLDAHISPRLAAWLQEEFGCDVSPVRELGLRNAEDPTIFSAARQAGAVVMTKDRDFVALVERLGSPPQVLWLRCGNTSNARLRRLLRQTLPHALALIEAGEPLVEISEPWS